MSIIFTITLILFLVRLIRDGLYFTWLWQIKEYRTDRMMSHLKNDQSIYKIGISYLFAIILLFLFFIFPENSSIPSFMVAVFFAFNIVYIVKELLNRSIKRPKPTVKVISIIFGVAILLIPSVLIFINGSEIARNGLLILVYIITPSIISASVLIVNPIFDSQKKSILRKAAAKMRTMNRVGTIGITGSYGKTSTKEFLYAILSQKYKVIKTEGNNNTNIGVAYTVLNKVNDDYDYFICEMGAYKIGEIKEMCDIVRPEIGILTGINQQHIELFGSLENTVKAKFELIEALPENGMAIMNAKLKAQSSEFKIRARNLKYFSIDTAKDIKTSQDHTEFVYKDKTFRLNLLGKHYIENLISAIIVSESLGMTLDEIKDAISKIRPNEYMIRRFGGVNGSILIDDSYSANPDGVSAALDYIKEAYPSHKKIIVFPVFIELGNKTEKAHEKLFRKISDTCEIAYILNNRKWEFENGNSKTRFVYEADFKKTANMLTNELDKNTIVLFESRGAGVVMKKIKNGKIKNQNYRLK